TLALCLWQRLIVRHLHHDVSNLLTKLAGKYFRRNALVFNRVVKQCCNHHMGIGSAGGFGNQAGYLEQVIDIGFLSDPLATLVNVPSCCNVRRSKNRNPFFHSISSIGSRPPALLPPSLTFFDVEGLLSINGYSDGHDQGRADFPFCGWKQFLGHRSPPSIPKR